MWLSRIEVENFRALRRLELDFDPLSALIGENSYGKTSLLDLLILCLGAGAEGTSFRFGARDFHVPDDPGTPPAERLSVTLIFRESVPGEWRAPRFAPLVPAASDDPNAPRIALRVDARRRGEDAPAEVRWSFHDRAGRPLAPAPGEAALIALRRLCPVIVVRANRYAVHPPVEWSGEPDGGDASPTRRIEEQIELVYRKLAAPAAVTREELWRGMVASHAFVEGLDRRFTAVPHAPVRLLEALAQAPLAPGVGERRPFSARLQGSASRSIALLVLLGAFLEARGSHALAVDAEPIVAIEDPEVHLHPTLLASVWSLIDALATQKIVTTNSGELLASTPLRSLRRLVRRPDGVRVHRLAPRTLSIDELRRIGYHIRVNRASSIFARCWLLVEGESEFWLMPELARVLGYDLAAEGVRCIEFAQCGPAPLVKLANDLGIEWHLIADGDRTGEAYAATARSLVSKTRGRECVTELREPDIEHALWVHGFEDVFRAAARMPRRSDGGRRSRRDRPDAVIAKAVHALSKPRLALEVVDEAHRRGRESVPAPLAAAIERTVRLARSFGALP